VVSIGAVGHIVDRALIDGREALEAACITISRASPSARRLMAGTVVVGVADPKLLALIADERAWACQRHTSLEYTSPGSACGGATSFHCQRVTPLARSKGCSR